MIKPSKLISSIKMDMGLLGVAVPLDNIDEAIMEIVRVKTLPVFNELQPYCVPLQIDLNALCVVERKAGSVVYEMPDVFGDAEIMYVKDLTPGYDEERQSAYNTNMFAYGRSICMYGYQDIMLAQAEANAMGAVTAGTTFQFISPNMLEVFTQYGLGEKYRMEVCISHAENLTTLPASCYTSFNKLATLDVKKYMYDNFKHYNDLQTAYGQISLKLEDWSGAEQERQALIEKWEQSYHLDLAVYYRL